MMTTTSAFGPSGVRSKLIAPQDLTQGQPVRQPDNSAQKLELLQKTIQDYTDGKITKEQFEVISNSLK